MSWFPTMDLRWIERIGDGSTVLQGSAAEMGKRVLILQQRWEQRWGQDIGGEEWRDIPSVATDPKQSYFPQSCMFRDCIADRLPLSQYCAVHVDGGGGQ